MKRKNIPIKIQRLLQKEINSKCPICFNEDADHFEVHHIDENVGNNDIINLIMLCRNCHSKVTKKDISQEDIINLKIGLIKNESKKNDDGKISTNIFNIHTKIKEPIIADVIHNITFRGRTKPKLNHPQGSIGANLTMRNYIKHLINRYQEYIKGDTYKNEKTKYSIIYNAINKEFGVDSYTFVSIEKFYELIEFIQMRIDKTILGKINNRKGIKNYSSLDEYLINHKITL